MKFLLDMNVSPRLCSRLAQAGWGAEHWSSIGDGTASDAAILGYAISRGYVVLSHDLDFSAILAATGAKSPSVVQIRCQDVLSEEFSRILLATLSQFSAEIENGALVVVDGKRARVRLLPLA